MVDEEVPFIYHLPLEGERLNFGRFVETPSLILFTLL